MRRPWRSRPLRGIPAAPSLAQPSSARHPCRSVLASVPSSARRMSAGNPCLWDRVTDVVWCCLRICLFGRGAGRLRSCIGEFSARQATGSFSLSVQAAGLRGLRQPLNNPGGRQPSLFLRLSLRPDGPSGCALPGAAVLCAASLPLRPGLRSLLSAPDAGRKTPACQSWFLLKAGVVCSECVQWDLKKSFYKQALIQNQQTVGLSGHLQRHRKWL